MSLSVPAFAEGNANVEAINGAIDGGKQMVSLTTSGVIGIAALGFGLGWLLRGYVNNDPLSLWPR